MPEGSDLQVKNYNCIYVAEVVCFVCLLYICSVGVCMCVI